VQAVAREMGYIANPTARNLRAGRIGAMGLYVHELLLGGSFYMEFVVGFAAAARKRDFAVTLIPASGARSGAAQVDGIVIVDPVRGDPAVSVLLESGVPVICAERCLDAESQPSVTIETDYVTAMFTLLDHMYDQGSRSPALLTVPTDLSVLLKMERGYRSWCEARSINPRVITTRSWPVDFDAIELVQEVLLAAERPDAILAAADGLALATVEAARSVGKTLLIASCVDGRALRLVTPGVTAIEAPPMEIGIDSARVLWELLQGRSIGDTLARPTPSVVFRGSTDRHLIPHAGVVSP
jgi:DNA-binding LacI/PurR family transcriptional regulator